MLSCLGRPMQFTARRMRGRQCRIRFRKCEPMTLDIADVMEGLFRKQPIFHSEADFQHALAWRIRETLPECRPRLEFNPFPPERLYLDIWLAGARIAIELKYRTRKLNLCFCGERFALRDQHAHDIGRYDFIRDIGRLERATESPLSATAGFAVMLTNDPLYWKPTQREDTVDAAFHLGHERTIEGEMAWSSRAAQGTTKGREEPLRLKGRYEAKWRNYRDFEEGKYSEFRYLAVEVPAPGA